MSLANLQLQTRAIPYNGQEIIVYGLSANDVSGLLVSQMSHLEKIFDIAEAAGIKSAADVPNVDFALLGQNLAVEIPGLIANIIAYAAHEPESVNVAMGLPAPVQAEAIKHIAQLTFVDEAGFREFLGNVVAALRSARNVAPQPKQSQSAIDSPNGG